MSQGCVALLSSVGMEARIAAGAGVAKTGIVCVSALNPKTEIRTADYADGTDGGRRF
jgi:hypothetical protein